MERPTQTKAHAVRGGAGYLTDLKRLYGPSDYTILQPIPFRELKRGTGSDWRDCLPDPASYYREHLNIKRASGEWATAICRFHDDATPSLSVNLRHGGFACHACGAKGDLLAFHRRLTGLSFRDAVRDLTGVSP